MPHVIARAEKRKRVVVVGAGPAGLEAARVAAERGHRVVLFESSDRTGGQVRLAARAPWRDSLLGITEWLEGQVRKRGVEVRLRQKATADTVIAEDPDVVVVATGGRPNKGSFTGQEHAVTTWDILSGTVRPGQTVLVYDDNGGHQAPSAAELLSREGARVELAYPDRQMGPEIGLTNFPIHLRELYKRGVVFTPDSRLEWLESEGNKLVAILRNVYSQDIVEREVDQVVAEHGTLPDESLYLALKPLSSNGGEVDQAGLVAGRPQAIVNNPAGRFQLFRVGDAVASRNIHAAIYDSLRLCKDF